MSSTRSSSHRSSSAWVSNAEDTLEPFRDKLNVFDLDTIKSKLIRALEAEHEDLLEEVRNLQVIRTQQNLLQLVCLYELCSTVELKSI